MPRTFNARPRFDGPRLDSSIVTGLLVTAGILLISAQVSGLGREILHLGSFILVVGGTLGATLVNYSFQEMKYAWSALQRVLTESPQNARDRITTFVTLAARVRKDGLLTLEQDIARCSDPFLRLAMQLTVDGMAAADIKRVLETEMRSAFDQERRAIGVFQTMGNFAPALGLIGTLLGLIQMLGSLQRPEAIGPAMSLALITTLYGALLANVVCLPIAGKLRNRCEEDSRIKAITVEGVTSLSKQESSIMLEQRLQSFMPLSANGHA